MQGNLYTRWHAMVSCHSNTPLGLKTGVPPFLSFFTFLRGCEKIDFQRNGA
jgi:hypothetical protein